MRALFAVLLAAHGLIHLLGFAKAFALAPVPQLHGRIGKPVGALWLLAALGFVAGAALLFLWPDGWWAVALGAIVLSQALIALRWGDARFGTLANALLLVPALLGLFDQRASSFTSQYRRDVAEAVSRGAPSALLTEQDLSRLPRLVQQYVRRAGAVGRPKVRGLRAQWTGEMRANQQAGWMRLGAVQSSFFDVPTRFFLLRANRSGLPLQALHRYAGASATLQVRLFGLFDVVDARGSELDRSETVTLLNDLCVLAPAALVDAPVRWQELDDRSVRAIYTNAGHTVAAVLSFDEAGDLVGFVSHDRDQTADGKTYRRFPWSMPLRGHRDFGGVRLPSRAEATWLQPDGPFTYARFELQAIEYLPAATSKAPATLPSSARSDAR